MYRRTDKNRNYPAKGRGDCFILAVEKFSRTIKFFTIRWNENFQLRWRWRSVAGKWKCDPFSLTVYLLVREKLNIIYFLVSFTFLKHFILSSTVTSRWRMSVSVRQLATVLIDNAQHFDVLVALPIALDSAWTSCVGLFITCSFQIASSIWSNLLSSNSKSWEIVGLDAIEVTLHYICVAAALITFTTSDAADDVIT